MYRCIRFPAPRPCLRGVRSAAQARDGKSGLPPAAPNEGGVGGRKAVRQPKVGIENCAPSRTPAEGQRWVMVLRRV
jgi:hypothetical protein